MHFITLSVTALASMALAVSHYDFTICSGGCTATGCTGNVHKVEGTTGNKRMIIPAPGTQCTIFYADSAKGKVFTCNRADGKGQCTQPGTDGGAKCFKGKNDDVICDTSNTQSIVVYP